MREVISLNGMFGPPSVAQVLTLAWIAPLARIAGRVVTNDSRLTAVGQAGCQIANSCWEVIMH